MFGQLFLALAFFILGTAYLLGFSLNNRVAKKLPEEYKRVYLRKVGLLHYLLAVFIVCMALVERYAVLTGGLYIGVYILGGCILIMLCVRFNKK